MGKMSRRREDYDGYIVLNKNTHVSDDEIKALVSVWVEEYNQYNVLGPNCQDFVADFHYFLTGELLQYSKDNGRVGKGVTNGIKVAKEAMKRPSRSSKEPDVAGALTAFVVGALKGAHSIKGPQNDATVQWAPNKKQSGQTCLRTPSRSRTSVSVPRRLMSIFKH